MRFDSFHPAINFIYFTASIVCAAVFDQPVFLLLSWCVAFTYSVKLNGKKALIFNLILIPFAGVYALYYSYYNHFGITNLRYNFIGNQITLESLVFGGVIGVKIITVIMWMSCVFAIVTSDKVIYLFGKLSPKLSLFLSILLRSVPRIKERARRIETAREGIGRGIHQGNVFERLKHLMSLVSILITWTLEDFIESSASMKSRGYSLKGRTAFSIYRFDNRDRCYVIGMFFCLMMILMAVLLNQTNILYNPEIIVNRITTGSYLFYAAYFIFLCMPLWLQIYGEWKFKKEKGGL